MGIPGAVGIPLLFCTQCNLSFLIILPESKNISFLTKQQDAAAYLLIFQEKRTLNYILCYLVL